MSKQVNIFLFILVSCCFLVVTASYASCPVPVGDWDYCFLCGPCSNGEGDCDSDAECKDGLRCHRNIGDSEPYYLRKGVDLCIGEETTTEDPADEDPAYQEPTTEEPATQTSNDADGIGTPVINTGTTTTTTTTTTTVSAACDDTWYAILHQSECNPSTTTGTDTSGDTTTTSAGGCKFPVGHSAYCWSCGPCSEGEGICNNSGQCAGDLVCKQGVCQQPTE